MNRPLSRTIALACASMCTMFGLNSIAGSAALAAPSSISQPADAQAAVQPSMQYLIILDVSGSMSWNIKGEGTLSGIDYQCEWDAPRDLWYKDGCSGPNSFWRVENERRIYLAKQMIGNLIDVMKPRDTMKIIAFSSGDAFPNYTTLIPASGWTSNHNTLKANLLTVGSYNNQPYITNGGSSNAQAILKAQEVVSNAPTYAPNGAVYRTVVVLVADGPANIFANGESNSARDICPSLTANQAQHTTSCQIGFSDKYQMDRPITAMISAATQLKQIRPVDLYTINMTNIDTIGMIEVASTPDKAYHYTSPGMLAQIAASYP